MTTETITVSKFKGLNNKEDRASLDNSWLEVADNVDIDNAGNIRRAQGYTAVLSDIVDMFHMRYRGRLYLIDTNRRLYEFDGNSPIQIHDDVGVGPYQWCELGVDTYLSGADGGFQIRPDGVYGWGMPAPSVPIVTVIDGTMPAGEYQIGFTFLRNDGVESGASYTRIVLPDNSALQFDNVPVKPDCETCIYISPPDGELMHLAAKTTSPNYGIDESPVSWTYPLATLHKHPPLYGRRIAGFDGSIWIAAYDSAQDITGLFPSMAGNTHLFEYTAQRYDVAGDVRFLAPTSAGLLIGTSRSIYVMAAGDDGNYLLRMLADYAAIDDAVTWDENNIAYFSTTRGVCRFPEFERLSEPKFAIPYLGRSPMLIREDRGFKQCLVSVDTQGSQHNPYGDRITSTEI